MRCNIYSDEITGEFEVVQKSGYTGLRFLVGPDENSAVTFWSRKDLRGLMASAIDQLDRYYAPALEQMKAEDA